MICSKCKDKGYYNEVLGKGFYYCRTCRDEITLEAPPKSIASAPKFRIGDKVFSKLNPFDHGIVTHVTDSGNVVIVEKDDKSVTSFFIKDVEKDADFDINVYGLPYFHNTGP